MLKFYNGTEWVAANEVNLSEYYTKTEVNNLLNAKANTSSLSTVATSGSYNDLSNKPTIPTNTNQLTNGAGFIKSSVNNLTNYYLKTETYKKSEIDSMVSAISTMNVEVVESLPATGVSTTIYLVSNGGTGTNSYDEYLYTNNKWEKIGTTDIDLSDYVTESEMNTALSGKADSSSLSNYVLSTTLTNTLKNYVKTTDLTTTLNSYVKTTDLNTKLGDYVTNTALNTKLGSYATTSAMNTALSGKANSSDLATVATTGSYNDLKNKPTLTQGTVCKYVQNIGNGSATSFTVTHNLNTRDVQVSIIENASPYSICYTDVEATTVNSITVKFAKAPTANQYKVVVFGCDN